MTQTTNGDYYVIKNYTTGFSNGDALSSLRNELKF